MGRESLLILMLVVVLFFAGCGRDTGENCETIAALREHNESVFVHKMHDGLSEEDITKFFSDCEILDEEGKCVGECMVVANPYRREEVDYLGKAGGVIVWYYVIMKKNDCKVGEDELVGVVLYEDKVVGWGGRFIHETCQREFPTFL